MSLSSRGKYGHISRTSQGGKAWRRAIVGLVCLWGSGVCAWNTGRIAALFGYNSALGEPAFTVTGYRCYWPWKLLEWASRFQEHEEVARIVDQTYLMGAGLTLALFLIYLASLQGLQGRDDLHGSARWAEYQDIDKMGYLKGEGVYVGGWRHGRDKIHYYLRHNGPEHVLCFAPTRSGKGVGLILPTLLAWEHSSVVLDIKGENFALTSVYLSSLGHQTLRFDPSDAEGASAAFNPLEEIRLDSTMSIPDVQQIASMVMDPGGKGLEDYWSKAAFGCFGGAVLHCLIKTLHEHKRPASLHDVAVMLEDPERPVKDVFDEMLKMDHAAVMAGLYPQMLEKDPANPVGRAVHIYIASAARGMLSKVANELSGVVNTAASNIDLYKDPVVAINISRCDFRLDDL
jgi:type IV secretion system protein VirD4